MKMRTRNHTRRSRDEEIRRVALFLKEKDRELDELLKIDIPPGSPSQSQIGTRNDTTFHRNEDAKFVISTEAPIPRMMAFDGVDIHEKPTQTQEKAIGQVELNQFVADQIDARSKEGGRQVYRYATPRIFSMLVWGSGHLLNRRSILTAVAAIFFMGMYGVTGYLYYMLFTRPEFIQGVSHVVGFILSSPDVQAYLSPLILQRLTPEVIAMTPLVLLVLLPPIVGWLAVMTTQSAVTRGRLSFKIMSSILLPGSGQILNNQSVRGAICYALFLLCASGGVIAFSDNTHYWTHLLKLLDGYYIQTVLFGELPLVPIILNFGKMIGWGFLGLCGFVYLMSIRGTIKGHRRMTRRASV